MKLKLLCCPFVFGSLVSILWAMSMYIYGFKLRSRITFSMFFFSFALFFLHFNFYPFSVFFLFFSFVYVFFMCIFQIFFAFSNLITIWEHKLRECVSHFYHWFPINRSTRICACERERVERKLSGISLHGKIKSVHKIKSFFPIPKWHLSHEIGRIDFNFASTTKNVWSWLLVDVAKIFHFWLKFDSIQWICM